jgi:ADP-ribosyl-[dinitrogen reductase] hydrolase
MDTLERFRGCLLGLAVGDALGTTAEFKQRGTFPAIVDMVGGGPFNLQPGEWTDDTSMALCLATSLLEAGGFDAQDQMRRYSDWHEHGYLSSTGRCFDIGNTVSGALRKFKSTGDPFSGSTRPDTAGNGSIMRLAPVPMYYFTRPDDALHYAAESSRTTHGATECLDACRLLARILFRALRGAVKPAVLFGGTPAAVTSDSIKRIAQGAYWAKSAGEIRGNGYVVDCLEAALWCFWTTGTFEAAILKAANLGDDADTTAAVCGQVAGAYYGEAAIPPRWTQLLAKGELIGSLADGLFAAAGVP